MQPQLPGERRKDGFWSKFGRGISGLIPPLYSANMQARNTDATIASNHELEAKRQQFQAAQLKMQVLLQKDNQAFQAELAQLNHDRAKEIEEFRQSVNLAISQSNLDFQRWRFEQEKALQLEIMERRQEFDRGLALYQRETAKQSAEWQKQIQNSPINLVASQLFEEQLGNRPIPLKIFLSPPELNYDRFGNQNQGFRIEGRLAEELRQFLSQNYPRASAERPTQLLDGAWESKRYRGESGAAALYSMLKSVPTLILESEIDGDYLNFRFAYWGLQGGYVYESVLSRLPYRAMMIEFAKERSRKWKETRAKLIAQGCKPEEADQYGGDNVFNLRTLQEEEKLKAIGVDTSELPIHQSYKLNPTDFEQLCQSLIICHCLIAGLIADIYYLTHGLNVFPILPKILPDLLQELPEQIKQELAEMVTSSYQEIYANWQSELSNFVPDLLLDLAEGLTPLLDQSLARKQVNDSIEAWLELRGVTLADGVGLFEAMESVLVESDRSYVEKLRAVLLAQEDIKKNDRVLLLLRKVDHLKRQADVERQRQESECKQREIEAERQRQLREKHPERFLQNFKFIPVTVDYYGREIRQEHQAQFFAEDLGNGVMLEMVSIPSGDLLMGSPETEKNSEYSGCPQHWVKVPSFFMGRFVVTQAQWREIARLPKIKIDISPDPSHFKGARLPVEQVSWLEASEFCQRLSQKTGRDYRLPSEAEWEYACRAGTETPFYFGEQITTELANITPNSTRHNYLDLWVRSLLGADAPRVRQYGGHFLKKTLKTTEVGKFPPNSFGLYDMHGNVWEWCQDTWHENYENAPVDGSAWVDKNYGLRLLRGGSWFYKPSLCRSAIRIGVDASDRNGDVGFRVVSTARNLP